MTAEKDRARGTFLFKTVCSEAESSYLLLESGLSSLSPVRLFLPWLGVLSDFSGLPAASSFST